MLSRSINSTRQSDGSYDAKMELADIEKSSVNYGTQLSPPVFSTNISDIKAACMTPEPAVLSPYDRGVTRSKSPLVSGESKTVMPSQRYRYIPWLRSLRWRYISTYFRLNAFVIVMNLIPILILGSQERLFTLSIQSMSTAVAANITASILVRQELFVNLLFTVFGCCPQWMPLWFRCLAAKIYHLGGVHSGAGIAAVIWFALLNVVLIKNISQPALVGIGQDVLVLTAFLDVLLLSLVGVSHPKIRRAWHNTWECIHRYGGWSTVIIFWAHYGIISDANRRLSHPGRSVCEALIKDPVFWLLLTTTIAITLPWLRVRKVAVRAEPLSAHAIRLHFTYTNLPLCAAPRLSDSPLVEWHSFAGIPESDGYGFSVIVSRAGDWTSKLIQQPPTHLWVRGIPVRGVLHIAPIFKSMVLVATGSGIGPVLSLLAARNVKCRILWSTRDPAKTYQINIMRDILLADPEAVILNTTASGRVDLIQQIYKLYKESASEAVFIISNPKLCKEAVFQLESRGVPAFAPIFDS